MTLDEAIEHANETVQKKDVCGECRADHLQLREWLKAAKDAKSLLNECYEWFGALCGEHHPVYSKPSGEIGKLMDQIEVWNRAFDTIDKMSYNNKHEDE